MADSRMNREFLLIDLFLESDENLLVMKAVIQRVRQAEVRVGGIEVARIKEGLLALVAISHRDSEKDLHWMAKKIVDVRIFDDAQGKLNLSLQDVGGQLLIVSQFTLYGDCRKGRRPSYTEAAPPSEAQKRYRQFIEIVRQWIPDVQTGQFQAMMEVALINSGPVTLILDSSSV
jgi:D-aminoacyl-tRNA deacylase